MPFKSEFPRDVDQILKLYKAYRDGLSRDHSLTPVEYLVKYYKYSGDDIKFNRWEWEIAIINDQHPRIVSPKGSQKGLTQTAEFKLLVFLEKYALSPFYYLDEDGTERNKFPTVIYTFESDDKARKFSADRLKALIKDNPHLSMLLEEGEIDQMHLKKFGHAALYLGGRRTVSSVISTPAEIVIGDEWDETIDPSIGEQLEARLKAAVIFRAKSQRGQMMIFSVPRIPSGGITKIYNELSDQMEFMIRDTHCGHWQTMTYPDSIANWHEKGQQKPKEEPYYQCLKCHKPLDWSTIGQWNKREPLKIHNAEWVPKRKEYYDTVTRYGEGYRGYLVPWGYSTSVHEIMRDRDTKSTTYFHQHTLGVAYEDKRTGLTGEVMQSISNPNLKFGYDPGYIHCMGVDQGAYAVIGRLIPNSKDGTFKIGKWQIVHAEFCPDETAFKNFIKAENGQMIPKKGRFDELMERFHITLCVTDGEPDGNTALNFQKDYERKMWINHSTKVNFDDPDLGFKWVVTEKDPSGEEIYVGRIAEDKSGALDAYFDAIYQGFLELPIHEDAMENFVQQHLNIKKTINEKKVGQRTVYDTVYYSVGMGDHFGQAGKFFFQAASLYHKLDYLNPSVIIASGAIHGTKFRQEARR